MTTAPECSKLEQTPAGTTYLMQKVDRLESLVETLVNLVSKKGAQSNDQEEIYTRAQTADIFHVSLVTLDKWTKDKVIASHIIGKRRVYYKKADIDNALKSGAFKNVA